jgi:hypothetical protein
MGMITAVCDVMARVSGTQLLVGYSQLPYVSTILHHTYPPKKY